MKRYRPRVSSVPMLCQCLCLLACLLAPGPAPASAPLDLDRPPDHLPYRLEPGIHSSRRLLNWNISDATACIDVDGDGVSEIISGTTPYIQIKSWTGNVMTASEQFNLPGRFTAADPCAWADGAWDLDRDGVAEVIVGSRSDDGGEIRFWALDPRTHGVKLEFGLPVGEDISGDGIWDGVYSAVGTIDVPTGEGPVPALLMVCLVRYDEFGRRVFAVDVRDGSVLWSLPLANCPNRKTTLIHDLDGDGDREILVVGNAPRNLDAEDGDEVGGLRDDVVRVYALAADGSRLWRTDFDVPCTDTHALLEDLDGDGGPELVIATSNHLMTNAVTVLDPADGAVRAAWTTRYGVTGLVAVDRPDGGRDLACSLLNGECHRLSFDGAGFSDRLVAKTESRIAVVGAYDLLPEEGVELVLTVAPRRLIALTADGRLALDTFIDSDSLMLLQPMTLPGGELSLMVPRAVENGGNWCVAAVPAPARSYGTIALIFGVLAAPVAAWRLRRRPRGDGALSLRDRRLALLERLQLAGHGRIGALQTVRRLEVKIILVSGVADRPPEMLERIRVLADRLRDETVPRLAATLDLAAAAEIPDHRIARARAALADLHAIAADGLAAADLGPRTVPQLKAAAAEIEGSFLKIRNEALAMFTASLGGTWARIVEELEEPIAEASATVSVAEGPPVDVGADPEELEFICENLLANALRAVAGSSRRRVDVSWEVVDGMVVVRVVDTGCGIAPDDWDRVLETRASTREGGGLGLPRSREILRRFGGRIRIVASGPGEGTTFEVELPLVHAASAG